MREVTQPVRARGTMPSAVAVVAALAALLTFAPFASATSDPLASGTTSITLNKGFFKKLKKNGVKVLKVSPATLKNRTVGLPVIGGSLDPTTGAGTVEHSGAIKFKRGKRTAKVNTLVLESATSSLKAKVAGKNMKLASVKGYTFSRNGFGTNVKITALKLTGKAAKQLNKKLGFTGKKKNKNGKKVAVKPLFKGNRALGASTSETQPKTVAVLPGGKASLLTNEATVKKFVTPIGLGGLGVEIKTVPPAETEATANPFTPKLLFPIGGGTIAPDANGGTVQTSGAVTLHQVLVPGEKETTMTLGAIYVDLSTKVATVEVSVSSTVDPKINLGPLGRSSIADLNLTGATIKSDPAAHTVTVENAIATLQEVTALTLNSVFGSPLEAMKIPYEKFAAGDGLGTFSFTATTQ